MRREKTGHRVKGTGFFPALGGKSHKIVLGGKGSIGKRRGVQKEFGGMGANRRLAPRLDTMGPWHSGGNSQRTEDVERTVKKRQYVEWRGLWKGSYGPKNLSLR